CIDGILVLFTANDLRLEGIHLLENKNPQQYFPTCLKAEIIENLTKRKNVRCNWGYRCNWHTYSDYRNTTMTSQQNHVTFLWNPLIACIISWIFKISLADRLNWLTD